ncbi:hypothetical protein LTR53_018046, partial [Teratosphaeriaceae sp. CCFEE 6253]
KQTSPYTLGDVAQIVLFGDSIFQSSFSPTKSFSFGGALADAYARKLDVINRGLSGYNTLQALRAIALCLPEPEQAKMRILVIMFGANDARLPNSPGGPDQHVSLEDYKKNLKRIVQHRNVTTHEGVRVILVTPPAVDERQCLKSDLESYPNMGRVLRRKATNTVKYAQAVRDVGVELELPVVDIHRAMLTHAGFCRHSSAAAGSITAPANPSLQSLLVDGLHLSGEGNRLLYHEVMGVIERTWPDHMPSRLPGRLPEWDYQPAWKMAEEAEEAEGGEKVGPAWEDLDDYVVTGTFEGKVKDVRKRPRV